MMPDLALLLEHSDLDVRLAAGENIAYLVEVERGVAAEVHPFRCLEYDTLTMLLLRTRLLSHSMTCTPRWCLWAKC